MEDKQVTPPASPLEGKESIYKTELEYIQRPRAEFIADQIENNIMPTGYTGKRLDFLKWAFNLGFDNGENWEKNQKAVNQQERKICGQTCGCISNEECAFSTPTTLLSEGKERVEARYQPLPEACVEHLHGSAMSTQGRLIFMNGAEFGFNYSEQINKPFKVEPTKSRDEVIEDVYNMYTSLYPKNNWLTLDRIKELPDYKLLNRCMDAWAMIEVFKATQTTAKEIADLKERVRVAEAELNYFKQ